MTKKPSDPRDDQSDEDFARNRIRTIRHIVEQFQTGPVTDIDANIFVRIKKECDVVLSRPRSNGAVIDALERTIGDLRSQRIDGDVYKLERDQALKRARAAEAKLKGRPFVAERLARSIDQWIAAFGRRK